MTAKELETAVWAAAFALEIRRDVDLCAQLSKDAEEHIGGLAAAEGAYFAVLKFREALSELEPGDAQFVLPAGFEEYGGES